MSSGNTVMPGFGWVSRKGARRKKRPELKAYHHLRAQRGSEPKRNTARSHSIAQDWASVVLQMRLDI